LAEGDTFDLLTMGRPEGPGCYCYVNNLLRVFVDQLMNGYDHVIIDNEAGMEHLSRRTARGMDLLLLVTDPTAVGVTTAKRLSDLAEELGLKVDRKVLLINGVRGGKEGVAEKLGASSGLEFFMLHEDDGVREAASIGIPVGGDGILAEELRGIMPRLFPSSRQR